MIRVTAFSALCAIWTLSLSAGAERLGKILYYNAAKSAPESAFLCVNGKPLAEQELPRWHFSPSIPVDEGELVLSFLPEAPGEGEGIPAEAPKVRIPEDWKRFLLLVFPDEGNGCFPIKVKALNASGDAFKEGDLYFVNFSKATVYGYIGEKKLILKPGGRKVLSGALSGGSGDCVARLDYFIGDSSKVRRFIRQTWSHSSRIRRMIFVLPKKDGGISYYATAIRDF